MTLDTPTPQPPARAPLPPTSTRLVYPAACPWCKLDGREGDVASDQLWSPKTGFIIVWTCLNEEAKCEYRKVL